MTTPARFAGHDLKELNQRRSDADRGRAYFKHVMTTCSAVMQQIVLLPQPVIAAVQATATAAGCQLVASCDLAIASVDARFGLSEVNWGITPGNLVTRALAEVLPTRDAMYYIMTGEPFDGRKAEQMRLVNEAVPPERLRERTIELANRLSGLSQWVVRGAKLGFRHCRLMSWETAEDFLYAKHDQAILYDEQARTKGMREFLDEKSYRPGLGTYES